MQGSKFITMKTSSYHVHAKILLSLVFLISLVTTQAQDLRMVKTFGGVRFESDTAAYSPKQVLEIMSDVPLAYQEFKKAKTNYGIAGAMGAIGGVLIGFPLGTALAGGDPEWALAAGGAALLLASVPISKSFRVRAQNALDIYNGHYNVQMKVQAGISTRGFNVTIYF